MNRFLRLASNTQPSGLAIRADAQVFSCLLQGGRKADQAIAKNHGGYLYVLEGGPFEVNGHELPALGAAKIKGDPKFQVTARDDAELLFVEVLLK